MNFLLTLALTCLIFLPAASKASEVTITRDSFGIPTLSGGDLASISRTVGQVHAEDRLWQIFLQNTVANGRLCQYYGLGPDEEFLMSDTFQREINPTDAEVQQQIDKFFTKKTKIAFENYVQGLNDQVDAVNQGLAPKPLELIETFGSQPIPHFTLYDNLRSARLFLQSFSPTQNPTFQLDNLTALMTLEIVNLFTAAEAQAIFEDVDPTSSQVRSLITIMNNNNATPPPPFDPKKVHRAAAYKTEKATVPSSFKKSLDFSGLPPVSRIQCIADKLKRVKELHKKVAPGLGSNGQVIGPQKSATGNPLLRCAIQPNFNHPGDFYQVRVQDSFFSGNYFIVPGIPFGIGMYNTFGFTVQTGHLPTNDYLFEPTTNIISTRQEIIQVRGGPNVPIDVFRSSSGGWVIESLVSETPTPTMLTLRSAFIERQLQGLNIVGDLPFVKSVPEFFRNVLTFDQSSDIIGFEGQCADCQGNFGAFQGTDWTELNPAYDRRLPQGAISLAPPNEFYNLKASGRRPMYDINNPQGYYSGWNNLFKQFAAGSADTTSGISLSRAYWLIDYLNSFNKISFDDLKQLSFRQAVASSIVAFNTARPTAYADLFTPLFKERFFQAVANNPTPDRTEAVAFLQNYRGKWFHGPESVVITTNDVSSKFILASGWLLNVAATILNPYLQNTTFEINAGSGVDVEHTLPSLNALGAPNSLAVYQGNLLARILGTSSDNTLLYPGWLDGVDVDQVIVDSLDTAIANLGGIGAVPTCGTGLRPTYVFNNFLLGPVWTMKTFNASGLYFVTEFGPEGITRIESVLPLGESGLVLPPPPPLPPLPLTAPNSHFPNNFDQFPFFMSFDLIPN